MHDSLKVGAVEALSARYQDDLEPFIADLVQRVEAAPASTLRTSYQDAIGDMFFSAAQLSTFGPDLPASAVESDFHRFDAGFPALAGASSLPFPSEFSQRLIAGEALAARKALRKKITAWIESGGYKSSSPLLHATIDARGAISVEDIAAAMVGMELAVHCAIARRLPR